MKQLSALDTIANPCAPKDHAKQDEPVETRENKECKSSAKGEEVKGDAIAEALAQTLKDFTNKL